MLACSGPDEASIIANYYPLVQSYLRQQQHQGEERVPLEPPELEARSQARGHELDTSLLFA